MKKLILTASAIIIACSIAALAKSAKDPVVMTVNGRDIRLSEFEYLYNKNNSQQSARQSVDDYVDLFIDYKLKVADAEAAGIDTTAAFLTEFNGFRDELAEPYIADSALRDSLYSEAYHHMLRQVKVSHIMVPGGDTPAGRKTSAARLDSIREAIVSGKTTFAEAAMANSIDKPSAMRGGLMGWLTPSRFPWAFEKAAYDTPVGSVSPVIDSGYGLHIILVNDSRPARGEVEASHILKLTRGLSPEAAAVKKAQIDSIYTLVAAGADFADMATRESEDPGSAARGGALGWFGAGVMVNEFDSVAFALADNEISKPFATTFGYHIIKRGGHRAPASYEESLEAIKQAISRDERDQMPRRAGLAKLGRRYGASVDSATIAGLCLSMGAQPDSTVLDKLASDKAVIAKTADGRSLTAADIVPALRTYKFNSLAQLSDMLTAETAKAVEKSVIERARIDLLENEPAYRNLVNEYRDGILLFDISNRKVWDRAAKDKEGLEEYFSRHRDKYTWDTPRYKAFLFFTPNDSVLAEALAYAETIPSDNPTTFVADMRKKFGRDLKIERVIAAEGENPITDYLGFGAAKPAPSSTRLSTYGAFKGRKINAPEEASDMRGTVVNDYQDELLNQWLSELRKKYPVKVNQKVLKKFAGK